MGPRRRARASLARSTRGPLPHVATDIDELVFAKLKALNLTPASTCSDAVFLRRVYLDVIGTVPTVDEARAFPEDRDANKRAVLVDRLLQRDEFADYEETRIVARDNTVSVDRRTLQIGSQSGRRSCAGPHVTVRHHLDGRITVTQGARVFATFTAAGEPMDVVAPRRTLPTRRRAGRRSGPRQEPGVNTGVSSSQPAASGTPARSGGPRAGRGAGVSLGGPRCRRIRSITAAS